MSNDEIIFNLRERLTATKRLEEAQKNLDAKELLRAERFYVETLLNYREKHGGLVGIEL